MKKTKISDAEIVVFALQDEIRRSHEARYDHRLHAVLLVAQGLSCRKAAQLFGDSPRAVAYWARRFEDEGLAGLAEAERNLSANSAKLFLREPLMNFNLN